MEGVAAKEKSSVGGRGGRGSLRGGFGDPERGHPISGRGRKARTAKRGGAARAPNSVGKKRDYLIWQRERKRLGGRPRKKGEEQEGKGLEVEDWDPSSLRPKKNRWHAGEGKARPRTKEKSRGRKTLKPRVYKPQRSRGGAGDKRRPWGWPAPRREGGEIFVQREWWHRKRGGSPPGRGGGEGGTCCLRLSTKAVRLRCGGA